MPIQLIGVPVDLVEFDRTYEGHFGKLDNPQIIDSVMCLCKPDGRRGLWFARNESQILLLSGREGDDSSFTLAVGDTVTKEQLERLYDVILDIVWANELAENNAAAKEPNAD